MRKSSPKPVSRLSSSASTASKVESREVIPVPPVRMKASTAGSAQPSRITAATCVGLVAHDGVADHGVPGLR